MIHIQQAKTNRAAMGLEKHGLSVFENANTTYSPAVVGGKVMHGLESREDIKVVEEYFGHSLSSSSDLKFWANVVVTMPHTNYIINPNSGPDVLLMGLLKASGELAPSIEEQADPNRRYKFVLYNATAIDEAKASVTLRRGKMVTKLTELYEKEPKYIIALCRYLWDFREGQIRNAEQAFGKLTEFIEGKMTKGSKSDPIEKLKDALDPKYGGNLSKETLYISLDVRDAIALNIIRFDTGKQYFFNAAAEGSNYGRTTEEVLRFLAAVTNSDHLGAGSKDDQPYSIRLQLSKHSF